MVKSEDLIRKRFGKLVVIGFERRKRYQFYFNCICDCGNEKWVRKDRLVKGETLSCGCIKYKDIIGEKFNRLSVVERVVKNDRGYYKCICECGGTTLVRYDSLVGGLTKSCGCITQELMDGKYTDTRIYSIYRGMKDRCYYPKHNRYERYGGRGIKICDEWVEDFKVFEKWALQNGYRDELSIDRIDNDGNYEPKNCRWATAKEQANNRTRHHRTIQTKECD